MNYAYNTIHYHVEVLNLHQEKDMMTKGYC